MKPKLNLSVLSLLFISGILFSGSISYSGNENNQDITTGGKESYNNYYTPSEYSMVSNESSSAPSLFSFGNGSEDDFPEDGATKDNENEYNDNVPLPVDNGILISLLFTLLYSIYIYISFRKKNIKNKT